MQQFLEKSLVICLRLSCRRQKNPDIRAQIEFKKYFKKKTVSVISFEERLILRPSSTFENYKLIHTTNHFEQHLK